MNDNFVSEFSLNETVRLTVVGKVVAVGFDIEGNVIYNIKVGHDRMFTSIPSHVIFPIKIEEVEKMKGKTPKKETKKPCKGKK